MSKVLSEKKILLIEDEPLIAMDIQLEIEDAGGEVIGTCRSCKAATLAVADNVFDAAIVDLNLRDGDTFEIAQILRDRKIPFIFATGDESSIDPDEWPTVPVFGKPGRPKKLVEMLLKLLS